MSLAGAMNSGISGLQSFSSAMGVIGNNLANTNTAGFKASRTLFSDLIPDTVSGSGGVSQIGRGSNLSTVDDIFTQGSIESTSSNLDLAIEGKGFFMVRNPDSQANNFTRAGTFRLNEDGFLVNPEGYIAQGYERMPGGMFANLTSDIQVNTRSSVPGQASSLVDLTTNLNAETLLIGGMTERAMVTFQGLSNGESVTVAGRTVTATGEGAKIAFSDIEGVMTTGDTIAFVYNGTTYNATLTDGTNNLQADINTAVGDDLIIASLDGTDLVLQVDATAGDIVSDALASGVFTDTETAYATSSTDTGAMAGDLSAAEVATAFADGVNSGSAVVTGTLEDWAPGALSGDTLEFTSTTADSNVEDISISSTPANLASVVTIDGSVTADFDVNNPVGTSNFATTSEIYDTLGNTHLVTTYFSKTGLNEWEYHQVVQASDLDLTGIDPNDIGEDVDGEPTVVRVGGGTLGFDESGILETINGLTRDDMGTEWPTVETIASGNLVWNNGSATNRALDYKMNITQFATDSRVVTQQADGYSSGYLTDITVDMEGTITGTYSNGESRALSRLALGKFANDNGLQKIGNNLYGATRASGPADIGTPGAGFGRVFSNSLEQSTVDIAEEFTKMITTQRSFQANSKTITTTDEMLSEVINMKR